MIEDDKLLNFKHNGSLEMVMTIIIAFPRKRSKNRRNCQITQNHPLALGGLQNIKIFFVITYIVCFLLNEIYVKQTI